jgi:hypothetical protein
MAWCLASKHQCMQASQLPEHVARAVTVARETRAQQLALRESARRALVRGVHVLTDAGFTRRAAADALGITCGAVQHALAEPCPAPEPEPTPSLSRGGKPTEQAGGPDSRARDQLLRHARAIGETEAEWADAIRLHERTLLQLCTDALCCFLGLPSSHPSKRLMLVRARMYKAALILDSVRMEKENKVTSKLLREQGIEQEGDEKTSVLVDLSALGVPRFEWPTYGDVASSNREGTANDVVEQLRDRVLVYAHDDVEHVLRANDGRSKPIGYNRGFGPAQFVEAAPKLAALLNQPYLARTDRADGEPLVATTELDEKRQKKLAILFSRWIASNLAGDVTRDDLVKLLRGMLRALGATKDAAKQLFEAEDAREMRRAERALA